LWSKGDEPLPWVWEKKVVHKSMTNNDAEGTEKGVLRTTVSPQEGRATI